MSNVIKMSDHISKVPPKKEVHRIGKHTATLTFQPGSVPERRWAWILRYVSEQILVGYDKDQATALKKIHKKIEERDGRNDQRRSK